jgi:peptide deformylase
MTDVDPEAPPPLDPETLARRDAALRHIRAFGDPVLRERARPVEAFDHTLREEVETMAELMDDALGVGLAATQVGILHRVLVYRVPDDPDSGVHVLVNPEIEWTSEEREAFPEGCLSLPGVWVDVERPARVRVVARDEHGDEVRVEAEGPHASVVQHEMDHLDGVLILDRLPAEVRKQAMRTLRDELDARRDAG